MGIHPEETLIAPTTEARLVITNSSGFTQRLEEGVVVGTMEAVTVVDPRITLKSLARVGRITEGQPRTVEWRKNQISQTYKGTFSLPEAEELKLMAFLMDHHEVFALEEGERGETNLMQLEIDTGNATPIKQQPRRLPFAVREEVAQQLDAMTAAGVIQPSQSPWASPVVLVRKKDGTHRFCVDYRSLNAVTKTDTYPLPRIDDLLDQLSHAKFFSTLDLAAGYWQIKVHPDSQPKTAFATQYGLHEFKVMPFGLKNAPAAFQQMMQQLLIELNSSEGADFVSVYIDDVLVFSPSLEKHVEHLERVITSLAKAGLKLKPSKCKFVRSEVCYLGHVITPQGLKTSEEHLNAVKNFGTPKDLHQLRQFLGLASYYRRFVSGFAKIANPLYALTRKNVEFHWNAEHQEAFEQLKMKLTSSPVLAYPKFDRCFVLETDASGIGLGAVLSQIQDNGELHPLAFASRALSPCEINYGITELETLAVVWAMSHFRTYLYGQDVVVITDHSAVGAVLQKPGLNGKHARWWLKVYDSGTKSVEIRHRPGQENTNADALSRNPLQSSAAKTDHLAVVSQIQDGKNDGTVTELMERAVSTMSLGEISSLGLEQRKDQGLNDLIKYLESETLPPSDKQCRKVIAQAGSFTLIKDVLYYLDPKQNYQPRAAVPGHLREEVMKSVHGGPFAGHFAGPRLYKVLNRSWWWEGMYKDSVNYCKSCPQCCIVMGGGRPGKPPLQPIPVSRPFQILGIDVMDLPKTQQGNKHVLVIQDYLSKWPWVFPIPDQKTVRIVYIVVKEIIPVCGVPEALLSDRGTNLLSYLMKDICQLLEIKKLNTTAYHPQCDGLTERFNRTLKTMLRKHADQHGTQWDQYLHGVLWAYRNTPHESTGEKPSFLLYGWDCRYPAEAAFLPEIQVDPTDLNEYRQQLIKVLTQARELAVQQIQAAQQKYKKQYDRYTSTEEYREGDWILIRFPSDESGKQRKLSMAWTLSSCGLYTNWSCLLIRYILMTRTQYKFIYIGSLGAPQVFQPGIFGMEISVKDPGDHLKNYIIQRENQIPTMTKLMTRTTTMKRPAQVVY